MGRRGDGYGSEDHLRRYLAEQPTTLDKRAATVLGVKAESIEWLDFPTTPTGDREFRALEFLRDTKDAHVLEPWSSFWPTRGKSQTWDLIGRSGGTWLLVEAKASWPEFVTTRCKATGDGLAKINKALRAVKNDLGVNRWFDWTASYYQHANRLAALSFLRQNGVRATLLGVYFTGDRFPDGTPCPGTRREWEALIEARRLTMGLPRRHRLSRYEHHLFLPALGA